MADFVYHMISDLRRGASHYKKGWSAEIANALEKLTMEKASLQGENDWLGNRNMEQRLRISRLHMKIALQERAIKRLKASLSEATLREAPSPGTFPAVSTGTGFVL
jgi:hypothetical protein